MKAFFCIAIFLNIVAVADTGTNRTPLWLAKNMVNEPILFTGEEGNRSGRLIFTPDSMPVLTRADGSIVYEAGKDYTWEKLLTRKNFADLSGNNVNHPNDFGHRLYAEVLFTIFGKT